MAMAVSASGLIHVVKGCGSVREMGGGEFDCGHWSASRGRIEGWLQRVNASDGGNMIGWGVQRSACFASAAGVLHAENACEGGSAMVLGLSHRAAIISRIAGRDQRVNASDGGNLIGWGVQ